MFLYVGWFALPYVGVCRFENLCVCVGGGGVFVSVCVCVWRGGGGVCACV